MVSFCKGALVLYIVALFIPGWIAAQAQYSSSVVTQNSSATTSPAETGVVQPTTDSGEPPNATILQEEPHIRQLGSAHSLPFDIGLTHIGPVYVSSAEFLELYGFSSGTRNQSSSLFRANALYQHRFRRSRIALQ